MYAFEYHRPASSKEALDLAAKKGEAKFLAGGQSLVQAMKLRLSAPSDLIDLGSLKELQSLKVEGSSVVVGAMVRHAEVAGSSAVQKAIPALAQLAGLIGDRQVRHMGTIGGALANNDPAADYPAAVLGLGATITTNKRKIEADSFFKGLYETALEEGELTARVQRLSILKFHLIRRGLRICVPPDREKNMYRFSYAEVLEETPQTSRERESMAIQHSIDMLKVAEEKGPASREAIEVLAGNGPPDVATLVIDLASNERVSLGRRGLFNVIAPYPLWPVAVPAGSHPVTRSLNSLTFAWAAPLEITDSAHVTPLWQTTDAGAIPARSRDCHVSSSNSRCCGSMLTASRGEIPNNLASTRSCRSTT